MLTHLLNFTDLHMFKLKPALLALFWPPPIPKGIARSPCQCILSRASNTGLLSCAPLTLVARCGSVLTAFQEWWSQVGLILICWWSSFGLTRLRHLKSSVWRENPFKSCIQRLRLCGEGPRGERRQEIRERGCFAGEWAGRKTRLDSKSLSCWLACVGNLEQNKNRG